MADHADGDFFDGDIFIYRGGEAPQHVTHVLIDRSLDEIEDDAFKYSKNLLTVETHDGLRKIGKYAFSWCESLRSINLRSAVEIGEEAFCGCENLESVEFGDRLETIGRSAFSHCYSLKHLKLPSIVNIRGTVFLNCTRLIDVELSERLETIRAGAFAGCGSLQRIAVPLKRDLFDVNQFLQRYNHFDRCEQLTTGDIVGGIDETVASLHMESWRADMIAEINRINQVLSSTSADEKTFEIQLRMNSVLDKLDHYKAEHCRYVREGISLLELALWKAKLDENEDNAMERESKKAKFDTASVRVQKRITCGADMVIKNVLSFLQLE